MFRKKFFLSFIFILATVLTGSKFAFADGSVQFINSPLWFSDSTPTAGEVVQIYTALFNSEDSLLTGTVVFYDRTTSIASQTFSIQPDSSQTVSVPWTVDEGDHIISATATNLSLVNSEGVSEPLGASADISIAGQNVTVAPALAPGATPLEPLPDTAVSVFNQVSSAEGTVSQAIPPSVKGFAGNIISATENFRLNTDTSLTAERDNLNKAIVVQDINNTLSANGNPTQPQAMIPSPFDRVLLFFLNIGVDIFDSPWLFYGIGALIVIMILRAVILSIRSV